MVLRGGEVRDDGGRDVFGEKVRGYVHPFASAATDFMRDIGQGHFWVSCCCACLKIQLHGAQLSCSGALRGARGFTGREGGVVTDLRVQLARGRSDGPSLPDKKRAAETSDGAVQCSKQEKSRRWSHDDETGREAAEKQGTQTHVRPTTMFAQTGHQPLTSLTRPRGTSYPVPTRLVCNKRMGQGAGGDRWRHLCLGPPWPAERAWSFLVPFNINSTPTRIAFSPTTPPVRYAI